MYSDRHLLKQLIRLYSHLSIKFLYSSGVLSLLLLFYIISLHMCIAVSKLSINFKYNSYAMYYFVCYIFVTHLFKQLIRLHFHLTLIFLFNCCTCFYVTNLFYFCFFYSLFMYENVSQLSVNF